MAILGFQLISTLVAASILSKLSSHFSFGRYILCGLLRYLHPSNEDLRQASGIGQPSKKRGGSKDKDNGHTADSFTVSKSLSIALETEPIQAQDVVTLHYYPDYQWLMDVSFCAFFVFLFNELFYGFISAEVPRFNLTLIWCVLVVVFAVRSLLQLTWMYFSTKETGEMMLIISCGFFCLVLSMGILIMSEDQIQLDLEAGHANFSAQVAQYLQKSEGPLSIMTLRLILAIFSGVVGACLTFPGLRYARCYMDAIAEAVNSPFKKLLLHTTFFWPLLVLTTWLTPFQIQMQRQMLWFDDKHLETLRLFLLLFYCFLRLSTVRLHLQAYLNIAAERIDKLRKEAGRINNREYQRVIARVFFYLCVVALQYIAPVLMLLFVVFLYKSHGGMRWDAGHLADRLPLWQQIDANSTKNPWDTILGSDIQDNVQDWALNIVQLRALFTTMFCRAILGFVVFWLLLALHITSIFGLFYHTYIIN